MMEPAMKESQLVLLTSVLTSVWTEFILIMYHIIITYILISIRPRKGNHA
jgi:hypothetical protein